MYNSEDERNANCRTFEKFESPARITKRVLLMVDGGALTVEDEMLLRCPTQRTFADEPELVKVENVQPPPPSAAAPVDESDVFPP